MGGGGARPEREGQTGGEEGRGAEWGRAAGVAVNRAARAAWEWRRRRDSNPRYPVERYNTLAGCRLQPLGHSSGSQEYIKDVLRLRAPAFTFSYSSVFSDLLVDNVGLVVGRLGFEDLFA